jgi:hypothetical protein
MTGHHEPSKRRERSGRHGWVSPQEQVDRLVRDPGLDLDEFDRLANLAESTAEAVRGLNHATLTHRAIPAPHVAPILGSLATTAWRLQQLLPQVSGCLAASLDGEVTGYRVSQDDGTDPLAAVVEARDHLTAAARLAGELGSRLGAAHQALSRQRYDFSRPSRAPGHDPADDPGHDLLRDLWRESGQWW